MASPNLKFKHQKLKMLKNSKHFEHMRDNTCGKVCPTPGLLSEASCLYKNYLETMLNSVEAIVAEGRDES